MTSYKSAGVDKEAGYQQVQKIKPMIKKTLNKNVLSSIGGFAALYEMPSNYKQPVLVSGTDGVGTKILLAQAANKYDEIGIDCVAMCVNDILCQGAQPLFFLDYIACGKNNVENTSKIVKGIVKGCEQANMALVGGETAEMPGLYEENEFDLAGFALGIVEKEAIIQSQNVSEDSILLALPSSGVHSNGYSLIRHIYPMDDLIKDEALMNELLKPTKIYYEAINKLKNGLSIQALAHITGGGIYENLARILPEGMGAKIDKSLIKELDIFKRIQKDGRIGTKEMYSTFNMGIGMIVIIDKGDLDKALSILGNEAYCIGRVVNKEGIDIEGI